MQGMATDLNDCVAIRRVVLGGCTLAEDALVGLFGCRSYRGWEETQTIDIQAARAISSKQQKSVARGRVSRDKAIPQFWGRGQDLKIKRQRMS